jgi:trigger factor
LNVTVTDQPGCKKEVHLEIPAERVRLESDRVIAEIARRVSLPGFRPGHVPRSVIKIRFQKEVRDEVVSQLLPDALGEVIRQKALKVVGKPEIDSLKFGDDESLDVKIVLEVVPEFPLSDYKNLSVTKRVYKVTDKEVDDTIEALRRQHAELVPVEDRASQTGDIVTINLEGGIEDPARPGEVEQVSDYDVDIELDDRSMKEFVAALTGVRAGESREFTVDYPADYRPPRLAGRRVSYKADIVSVRMKELPELEDEFAQSVSESYETMETLRAAVVHRLEESAGHKTKEGFETGLMDELVNRNQFEVPGIAVEKQIDSRMKMFVRQMASRGIDPRKLKVDWEALRESNRVQAEREVRGFFILSQIADTEKIEVSEAELNQELERVAAGTEHSVAALKARLTKENALDSMKEQIRNRKALEFVISSADIRLIEVEGLDGGDGSSGGRQEANDERAAETVRDDIVGSN